MIDSFVPFAQTLRTAVADGTPLDRAWEQAAAAATLAAEATADLRPNLGRARPLAEKSLGHPDAGAVSLAMIVTRIGQSMMKEESRG